jgi:hypothetical protein
VEGRGVTGETSITVRVPMAIRKRDGSKVIVSPEGSVLPGAASDDHHSRPGATEGAGAGVAVEADAGERAVCLGQ